MPDLLAATVLALAVAGGPAPAVTEDDVRRLVVVQDPAIAESSGLVAAGDLLLTVNDSGDRGVVYAVDARSGRTVGRTVWSEAPVDVEALAPGPGDTVWVGDIGDNRRVRPWVAVSPVPVSPVPVSPAPAGRGDRQVDPPVYRLRYPDGPHDAEALLAHPGTGRLYVATKGVLGGRLYAAPARLAEGRLNRLRPVGAVGPLVTDGAFLDGRRLVLRGYGRASVLSFPALAELGSFDLPPQPQGEAVAVTAEGDLLLSSEGVRQPILSVPLPPGLTPQASSAEPSRAAAPPPGEPGSEESGTGENGTGENGTGENGTGQNGTGEIRGWRQARRAVGAVIAVVLLVVLGRRLRRRGVVGRRR